MPGGVENHVGQTPIRMLLHEGQGVRRAAGEGLRGAVSAGSLQPARRQVDSQHLLRPDHARILDQQLAQRPQTDHDRLRAHAQFGAAHRGLGDGRQLGPGRLFIADAGGYLDDGRFDRDDLAMVGGREDAVAGRKALHLRADLLHHRHVAVARVEGILDPVGPVRSLVHLAAVADALGAGADQANLRAGQQPVRRQRRGLFAAQFGLLFAGEHDVPGFHVWSRFLVTGVTHQALCVMRQAGESARFVMPPAPRRGSSAPPRSSPNSPPPARIRE